MAVALSSGTISHGACMKRSRFCTGFCTLGAFAGLSPGVPEFEVASGAEDGPGSPPSGCPDSSEHPVRRTAQAARVAKPVRILDNFFPLDPKLAPDGVFGIGPYANCFCDGVAESGCEFKLLLNCFR